VRCAFKQKLNQNMPKNSLV